MLLYITYTRSCVCTFWSKKPLGLMQGNKLNFKEHIDKKLCKAKEGTTRFCSFFIRKIFIENEPQKP